MTAMPWDGKVPPPSNGGGNGGQSDAKGCGFAVMVAVAAGAVFWLLVAAAVWAVTS